MAEAPDYQIIELLDGYRTQVVELDKLNLASPLGLREEDRRRWGEMAGEVAEALQAHPEFRASRNSFFLSRQIALSPSMQAENMLRYAGRSGGRAAADWYRKALNARNADLDVITEVHGISVQEPIVFSNGVKLVPPTQLNDSPQARTLAAQSILSASLMNLRFPAAALISLKGIPLSDAHDDGHQHYLEFIETIRRTVTALSLADRLTPTTGVSWIDFHDPDLNATSFGLIWQGATYDGRQAEFPQSLDKEAIQWVERLLALAGPVASKCDVALARLNLARRRQTPGDKAIDGCIALEAVLGDGLMGDLTYKLKLRTARLLGSTYEERKEISAAIAQFYSLRGKVVHGQSRGIAPKDNEAAKRGLELTLALLRKVVLEGEIPPATELELGPVD